MVIHSPKTSQLTTGRAENMIQRMTEQMQRGRVPAVDLGLFHDLDLGALTTLLAFAAAAREGKLLRDQPVPALPIILPKASGAKHFLFSIGFFRFASLSPG